MKPTIRETVVRQIELCNLNDVVDIELLGEHPDGDCWDYDWVHDYDRGIGYNSVYWKENEHIPIDMLLEAVEKLKAEGVTHIQIYPHGDHESYYLTGVKLEVMAEKEVLEKRKKELKEAINIQVKKLETDRTRVTESTDFLGELYEKLEKLNDLK